MATFILHGQYSAQAIKGFLSKPEDRTEALGKLVEACGAKLKDFYVTSGENDFVVIVEADNEESAAAIGLIASAAGTVAHTATSRAWTSAEFKKMCEKAAGASSAYRLPGK